MLDTVELTTVAKLIYVGCYCHEHSCKTDVSYSTRKFYGNFNNILSAVRYIRNELATLHIVKTYCVPSVLYGSEMRYLDNSDYTRSQKKHQNFFAICYIE